MNIAINAAKQIMKVVIEKIDADSLSEYLR